MKLTPRPCPGGAAAWHSGVATLRHVVAIAAGLAWSIAFIVLGLHDGLQMYGDGSIFSYAVAVQDSWAFHFHNISGRSFVWLYVMLPAELLVAVTHDPMEGVALYGFLFFSAQLLALPRRGWRTVRGAASSSRLPAARQP